MLSGQQRFTAVVNAFQLAQQLGEQLHVPHVDCRKLLELTLILAVMRQIMITVGNLDTFHIDGGRVRAVEEKSGGLSRSRKQGGPCRTSTGPCAYRLDYRP